LYLDLFSRLPLQKARKTNEGNPEADLYAEQHDSGIRILHSSNENPPAKERRILSLYPLLGIWIAGRTVLNLWRVMNSELKLASNSFDYVVLEVLGLRAPQFSDSLERPLTLTLSSGARLEGSPVLRCLREWLVLFCEWLSELEGLCIRPHED
jgi:hypothetical protein